jgi:uncharacterized membrane protein
MDRLFKRAIEMPRSQKIALSIVFVWFSVGGIMHFVAPEFFLKIVPPRLPLRLEAVYISGFFELTGALALLLPRWRRVAGWGLIALTVAVTPANVYMWMHADLFPRIPEALLLLRLLLQVILIGVIWWATQPRHAMRSGGG